MQTHPLEDLGIRGPRIPIRMRIDVVMFLSFSLMPEHLYIMSCYYIKV